MTPTPVFPRLTPSNHRETSPADHRYNCIAWAVEDTARWWQPGLCWRPADWPRDDCCPGALESMFLAFGYEDCGNDWCLEPGYTKVALYAAGGWVYTHAARQLPTGMWTSQLGKGIDIEHDDPEVVAGGLYGHVLRIMKRSIQPAGSHTS